MTSPVDVSALVAEAEFLLFKARLPPVIVALDVETTGLSRDDRVASVGLIRVEARDITPAGVGYSALHMYCNPGRPSHPRARAVHGLADAFLAGQPAFSEAAPSICAMLDGAGVFVAHNASFDARFVRREMELCARADPLPVAACTLNMTGLKLDAACARIGLSRVGVHHGALEDAWLALMVYLAECGAPRGLIGPMPGGSVVGQEVAHREHAMH